MQIVIRNTNVTDAEAVNRLSEQLGYALSVEETTANIQRMLTDNGHTCFVATLEQDVAGWIHCYLSFQIETKPFAVIGGLVVDELYRNRGLGKLLVERVKEWCYEKEVYRLRLRSNVKRTDAHRFYESLGFTVLKEQKAFELNLSGKTKDHQ